MSTRDYGSEYVFKPGSRCDIRQYRLLLKCSQEGNVEAWNNWRKSHPDEETWLCGVNLAKARCDKINLSQAHLEGAVLTGARLEDATICEANLDGAILWQAHLEKANLWRARMDDAQLWRARLQNATLTHARLKRAFLHEADLRQADLSNADLTGAVLAHARLEGTKLNNAQLRGADIQFALIDGATKIVDCEVDRDTDFRGVGLDAGRVEPGLSQLLKYNIRRKRWIEWYRIGPPWLRAFKLAVVGSFWWISDYGHSTLRLLLTFVLFALAFAGVYYCNPGWLDGLNSARGSVGAMHALYYSVVVMTTLGFGDVHPRGGVWQGQVLLIVQVMLGYVLLGALITRLSVLFTAGGPAAHFSKRKLPPEEPPAT